MTHASVDTVPATMSAAQVREVLDYAAVFDLPAARELASDLMWSYYMMLRLGPDAYPDGHCHAEIDCKLCCVRDWLETHHA
jgi:hypothetical protein